MAGGPDSAIGMIMFVLLGFGSNSRDLVSYLNPDDYFKARQVDVRVANLLELAAKSPRTGKDQVMQLLAIRKLGANPAEALKDARVRALLMQIADGQKGKDRLGFAEDYARKALAQLEGKQPSAAIMPRNSLRSEAFAWFPKETLLVAGFDLRPVKGVPAAEVTGLQKMVNQFTKQANVEGIYEFVEKVGNMRIDRFSFGMAPNPQGVQDRPNGRIYVRVTGKADHGRMIDFLREVMKVDIVKQERDANRRDTITYLRNIDRAPALAVIGDSELLIAGYMEDKGDHMGVLFEMMEARSGKRPSVITGPLADRLKKANPQTFVLLAGDISKDLGLGPLNAPGVDGRDLMPKAIIMELTRNVKGVDLILEAAMRNAEDAQTLVEKAQQAIRDGIEQSRRELQRNQDVPKEMIELLTKTLESIKTAAKGPSATMSVHVSNDVLNAVPDLLGKMGAIPGGPRREFKKEEKEELKRSPARERGNSPRLPQGAGRRQAAVPSLVWRVVETAAWQNGRRGFSALRR